MLNFHDINEILYFFIYLIVVLHIYNSGQWKKQVEEGRVPGSEHRTCVMIALKNFPTPRTQIDGHHIGGHVTARLP